MILQQLKDDVVLGDGGAIFEMERRGYISAGPVTPEVVVEHPEAVRQLQTDFARAGAQVLQALTYYAHEEKLKEMGKEGALREINAVAVDIAREAMEQASLVVGEVNTRVPFTFGDTIVSVSDFDLLVKSTESPSYFKRWPVNKVMDQVAANIAQVIEDEDCISFHTGSLFEALGRATRLPESRRLEPGEERR